MIQGNIAIPSPNSLKRPRPRRKPRSYPADMPTIVIPKRKPNSILAHLLEDITPEEHRRRSELAKELFRTITRRVQQTAVEKPAPPDRSHMTKLDIIIPGLDLEPDPDAVALWDEAGKFIGAALARMEREKAFSSSSPASSTS